MDGKTLKILIVIFFILLGIVVFPMIQSRLSMQHASSEIKFDTYTADQTKNIIIKQGTSELTLTHDGKNWNVASYAASSDKISGLFSAFKEAKVESVVSSNPNNSSEYGVSTESAMTVTISGTFGNGTIRIGKSGPVGNSFYAKKNGSKNVYEIDGGLLSILSANVSDWRDRSVLHFSSPDAYSIVVMSSSGFELSKNADTSWQLTSRKGGKKLADADIRPIIDGLSTLTASDFYTNDQAMLMQQKADKRTLTIKDKNGKVINSLTLVPDGTDFFVMVDGKKDFYKVSGESLSNLFSLAI